MPRKKTQNAKQGAAAENPKRRTHRTERDVCATLNGDLRTAADMAQGATSAPADATQIADIAKTATSAPPQTSRAEVVSAPIRLLPYQRRWVEDRSSLKMVVKARQIGYSFAATLQALLRCLERKTTWIFLSKGERQSKLLMEKVQEHIQSCGIVAQAFESSFFEGASQKQLEVRLPNGSVIYGLPSNPDTARGYSGSVTLDEFAFHADAAKIYSALFPTITRGYSLEVISTPNGQQGKFYELAKAAGLTEFANCDLRLVNQKSPITNHQSPMAQWSSHWCDLYEAVRQGLKINIELLRAGCDDESTFQQEFCCQFVSTAENFFPPELLAACLSAEASVQWLVDSDQWSAKGSANHYPLTTNHFFLGIDIGRHHDRTVFWLDEAVRPPLANGPERSEGSALRNSRSLGALGMTGEGGQSDEDARLAITRMVRTLDRTPFAEQLECARELLRLKRADGSPLVRRAAIDATGIGAMLAETLAAEFGPRVEPVTFTVAVKEDLAYRTKRRMEKQLSLLPDTREVRRAFSAVKRVVTPSGNLRFDAVRTAAGHADEFWAKALADLAADSEPLSSQADAYLAGGAAIINPRAFTELDGGWGAL